MGFNETYEPVRAQILMMTLIASLNMAYSMLVERESQRAIINSATDFEVTGMTALVTGAVGASSQPKKNWNLICDFCQKKGHTKAKCYKIVGYPDNFSFRLKKKLDPAAAHNAI